MHNSETIDGSSKKIIATDEKYKYFRLNLNYFNNENNNITYFKVKINFFIVSSIKCQDAQEASNKYQSYEGVWLARPLSQFNGKLNEHGVGLQVE
jgi:hypothetical protein